LFLSQVAQVFAAEQKCSKEIERVEVKDGLKIIYYTDGTKKACLTIGTNVCFHTSSSTSVIKVYTSPDWSKITEIAKQIFKTLKMIGLGCFLLASRIWNIIKSLRKGRPRDYHGVGLNYS